MRAYTSLPTCANSGSMRNAMAIYHFSAKVIGRAAGSSAVAAAAYRSASCLHDERLERNHDFSNKAGVVHSEVLLPEGAPARLADRSTLWNTVEQQEKRRDAQLAREIEFSIPRELSPAQGVVLVRDFVAQQFVARGMVADLNVHWDKAADGSPKPHAHVMLATREVGPHGFGNKVRDWNANQLLRDWREAWAAHVNARLAELGIEARIDHRTLEAQGIALEPQNKIGPAGARRELHGENAERAVDHMRIARDNGAKILADPGVALDAITRGQATFTLRDLAMFVHRHSEEKGQFDAVLAAVKASPELVALGTDGRGNERFTSREMIAVEDRLVRAAGEMAGRDGQGVAVAHRQAALTDAEGRGLTLSGEQRDAFEHVTGRQGLAAVVGYAGSGKSAMLGVARAAWEGQGFQVRGAALSGIAAENLEGGSGIASRTIASLEHQWGQGRELLTPRDVLVVDEAGMIGTRQLERVLTAASAAGAKVVLVGDPEQLQAIEAGAAFRSIAERHGAVEITQVRRQREDWQRDATRALATGRTGEAIGAYETAGMIHAAETRDDARRALIDGWARERAAEPGQSRIILTHTNAEVQELNALARERLREAGGLGDDVGVKTERGERSFAAGDRLMFLRNERSLGVKNGTLATIGHVAAERLAVRLDDGRDVVFDTKDYAHVDHGYAATIHKSQGVTVDRVHVLATPGLDRHGAYVALTRHRERVDIHYGRDEFKDQRALVSTLSRERAKDMAGDYAPGREIERVQAFAEAREIRLPEALVRRLTAVVEPVVAKARGIFAGFRPKAAAEPAVTGKAVHEPPQPGRGQAVERYARAVADMQRMTAQGLPVLAHQEAALTRAGAALNAVRADGASDLASALRRAPELAGEAAGGQTTRALQAMAHEAQVRADPILRADRFVEQWQGLQQERARLADAGDRAGVETAGKRLEATALMLQRDPQVESVLRGRVRELGLEGPVRERQLSQELVQTLGLGRSRGLTR